MLRPRAADPSLLSIARAFGGSLLPIVAGFWLSISTDSSWMVLVTVATLVLAGLTLYVLDLAAQPHGHGVAAPAVAVVLATSTLLLMGSLLVIRLVVVRDPALPFGAGLAPEALEIGKVTLVEPLAAAIVAVLGCWWLVRPARSGSNGPGSNGTGSGRGGPVRRWLSWLGQLDLVRGFTMAWSTSAGSSAERARQEKARIRVIAWGSLATIVLMVLPRFSPTSTNAYLYFANRLATPEWGKIVYLLVVAMMATRYQHRYGAIGGIGLRASAWRLATMKFGRSDIQATWVKIRHIALPVGAFVIVAAVSRWRQDFGTIVPVLAATIGVTWAATRLAVEPSGAAESEPESGRAGPRVRRTWAGYAVFLVVGLALFGAVGAFAWKDSYVQDRAHVWADPWVYRWDAGCVEVAPVPADAPKDAVLCQQSMVANQESSQAQISHVLATIADGGLWGRGLHDTASGATPAGDSDFILAVMWDKLGGVAVLLSAALVILLGAALRAVAQIDRGAAVDPAGGRPRRRCRCCCSRPGWPR